MFGRIGAAQSAAEDDYGSATNPEHGAVRFGVDAPRAARDNGKPGGGEGACKSSGLLKSSGPASARANHCHTHIAKPIDIARDAKQRRRIGNL